MNLFRTVFEFVVKDRGTAALGSVIKTTERAGAGAEVAAGSFKNLAGAFTSLVVAAKVRNALQAVIEPARKMDQAIARLAFTSGRTRKEIDMMRVNAEKVAEITVFGPQEAMDATLQLNRVLRGTKETMLSTNVAAKLAQASFGAMTLKKSTQLVSEMGKAFGMNAAEISMAGDKIYAMSMASGVGVEKFASIMGRLGTAAAVGGQQFDDVLQAFAVSSRLLNSELQASNLLMSTFAKLTSEDTRNSLRALGVEVTTAGGTMRSIGDIMKDLAISANLNAVETRDRLIEAFGIRTLRPMVAMLRAMQTGMINFNRETGAQEFIQGPEVFDKLAAAAKRAAGMLDKGVNKAMQNADAQMRRLDEAWTTLKTAVGSFLLEAIYPVAQVLASVVKGMADFLRGLGPVSKALVRGAVILAALVAAWAALRWTLGGARDILRAVGDRIGLNTAETAANTAATTKNTLVTRIGSKANTAYRTTWMNSRLAMKLSRIEHGILAPKIAATQVRMALLDTSVKGTSLSFKLATTRMRASVIGMKAAAGAVRTLRTAFVGLKTVLKGLFTSGGLFGLIVAFLPEIQDGLKGLWKTTEKWVAEFLNIEESLKRVAKQEDASEAWVGEFLKMEDGIRKLAEIEWGAKYGPIPGLIVGYMRDLHLERLANIQMLKDHEKVMQKEALIRKASAKVAASSLILGTKGFERTVNKLEGLVKAKPKAIDIKDVVKAQNWLKTILATPVGRYAMAPSGVGVRVTQAMHGLAQRGLDWSQAAVRTIRDVSRDPGKAMTGKLAALVQEGFVALDAGIKATVDTKSTELLEAGSRPAMAVISQMKGPQIAQRTYQMGIAGAQPRTMPDWYFGGLGEAGSLGAYARKIEEARMGRRGMMGPAPERGRGLVTERAARITQESPYETFQRAWDENTKQLAEIDKDIKRIRENISSIVKIGLKLDNPKYPGGFSPYYVPMRR